MVVRIYCSVSIKKEGIIMGGINCYLPHQKRPGDITMTELRNSGLEYAKIVKNIFDFSAYFSLANANIEKVMLDEVNQKGKAKKEIDVALDQLKKAMNACQVSHLQLEKFVKELPQMQQELDPTAEKNLSVMSKRLTVIANRLNKLIEAYEGSNITVRIEHGDLNVTIRNNSVTFITEQLAIDLSDILMDLKNNSVYDRKKSLQKYDLAI